MTRSAMLEVLREDYIRTAKAKGLWLKLILVRHALKNAMLPVVTVIGLEFAFLLGGLVVTEQVFNLNGLGLLFVLQRIFYIGPIIRVLIPVVLIGLGIYILRGYIFKPKASSQAWSGADQSTNFALTQVNAPQPRYTTADFADRSRSGSWRDV